MEGRGYRTGGVRAEEESIPRRGESKRAVWEKQHGYPSLPQHPSCLRYQGFPPNPPSIVSPVSWVAYLFISFGGRGDSVSSHVFLGFLFPQAPASFDHSALFYAAVPFYTLPFPLSMEFSLPQTTSDSSYA